VQLDIATRILEIFLELEGGDDDKGVNIRMDRNNRS
jgi:hypothetical protein